MICRIILVGMKEVGVVENCELRIKDYKGGIEKLENEWIILFYVFV